VRRARKTVAFSILRSYRRPVTLLAEHIHPGNEALQVSDFQPAAGNLMSGQHRHDRRRVPLPQPQPLLSLSQI
ncbi:MAG TPA: hypothetical protein VFA40_15955, partial [Terriglobales bacterium]|nr:hypothetical protein [Terriglobales bacterium]